ncbi:hypothetical protein M408DRAFT_333409 [Serendipita vermifera MAFF 305830]|uniref:Uncharacterized protein n=1 Tax=Serendipita vermifera MAFF 305830 TaxID=933852 RepID=A0A0C2WVY8_SERVB|nr:hypothetical protein M408DRAFT_333409 [Serendipita vermifera MAFF 305830]
MSWTTSPPYSIKSVSRQQTESTAATTPPPVPSPKSVPRSLTILNTNNSSNNNNKGKPRTPIAPHKLAQLANALGVATPSPGSVPYPLYSPSTPNSASFGTSNQAPSRYLLHVIPPLHLLQAEQEDANDPHVRAQFRRGTLVSLHPTLPSQLGAIAREFSLPSTGGMILYLITAENDAGPRITDDAWRMLWFRALQIDKDGSVNGKNIARHHSRSTTSNSPYPSPSSTSESPYGRLGSPSSTSDNTPASSFMSLELPININPGAALPILAKVEFDIDRRKAPWYEIWKHRRRTASHSIANSPQYSGGLSSSTSSSKRVLQLPLRARSTSPSLAEFKAKYTGSADGSGDGYARLDDEFGYVNRGAHLGQFTDDPLEDVFPSDRNTWAQIRVQHDDGDERPATPHTPDVLIGGRIGSTILSLDGAHEEDEFDENDEDVVRLWKQNHKPTLDSLGAPLSPGLSSNGTRSRSASKHVPPPLDLTASSKSQIPHVEVAPPTATSPNMSINSDLPYLDSDGTVNPGQKAKKGGNESGSEEARSRRLDELERRIENLSPRSQWDEEEAFTQQSPLMESPESTSPLKESVPIFTFDEHGDSEQTDSTNDNGPVSKTSLPVPSTKASRRQVSIGSFNALPNASDLAKALAAASNSPPLPAVPLEDEDARLEREEERDVIDISPIDLATPMTPGFPISPDPFNKRPGFGIQSEGEKSDLTLVTNVPASGSPVSPPPRMSSRFSADSATSEDGQPKSRNDRTGSVISVKGIRSLWRKSGNSKNVPLMSPGINGQQIVPPTPPPFMEASSVPPLPMSSGGFFSPISLGAPPMPKSASPSADAGAPPGTPRTPTPSTTHRRSESGLDPFHFDQDSRYPVHKMPSPSQAFPDQFPPSEPVATSPPPPPSKKGILKGWGSKGSSMKRASTELINAGRTSTSSPQPPSHPPSSFGSTGASKKAKRPSISGIIGGHSKQNSKASISSVGTSSKHTYPNNSLSGTSHASSHHGTSSGTSFPEPPSNLAPSTQPIASGRSSHEAAPGHKSSGSNGSALTTGEPRKSTPPPSVGAVAMAAAVAASRERRGTSYIGPADNRI